MLRESTPKHYQKYAELTQLGECLPYKQEANRFYGFESLTPYHKRFRNNDDIPLYKKLFIIYICLCNSTEKSIRLLSEKLQV